MQSANSSIWNMIFVRWILVYNEIGIKMEYEYWRYFMKKSGVSWREGVFYIPPGLSCDVSGTVTNRALFVGVLKVA